MVTTETMAKEIAKSNAPLEDKLKQHFNLFEDGGLPQYLVPLATSAIVLANNGWDWGTRLPLPAGTTRYDDAHASILEIIEDFRLQDYVKAFSKEE